MAAATSVSGQTPRAGDGDLYERDFARWTRHEAALLKAGRFGELDLANLIEEVESLGREQFDKVRSHLRIVLIHMLKWDHQPGLRTRSWTLSIRDGRNDIESVLESNPSLKRRRDEAVLAAYRGARVRAALETDLPVSTFPEQCPYGFDEIMTRRILWHDD